MKLRDWIIVGVLLFAIVVWNIIISTRKQVPYISPEVQQLKVQADSVRLNEVRMWAYLKGLQTQMEVSRKIEDSLRQQANKTATALAAQEKTLKALKDGWKTTHYQDSSKGAIKNILPK